MHQILEIKRNRTQEISLKNKDPQVDIHREGLAALSESINESRQQEEYAIESMIIKKNCKTMARVRSVGTRGHGEKDND